MSERSHEELLVRLHPRGPITLERGSDSRRELAAWGEVFDLLDEQVDELLSELMPHRATSLLSSWEALYDVNRGSGRTDAHRRRVLTARARRLPNCRPATLEGLLATLIDMPVTVVEPFAFRCDHAGSLCDSADDVLDGEFGFFVTLDEAIARSTGVDRWELEDELAEIKPAHVVAYTRCDDFRCDDTWSLLDRDLLGA